MVNAVHAVASSLASVKTIIAVEYTSPDIIVFSLSGGVSITSRLCYFDSPLVVEQYPLSLTDCQLECLYQAGRRYIAEQQACFYLNRAEHSTYQLSIKLQKKDFSYEEYQPVLHYLTTIGVLDDSRFAASWLHTRSLSKKEGSKRLFAELRKRGISAKIAQRALNDFFSEIDETSLCQKAINQLMRKGYRDDKLVRALQRKGFTFATIKRGIADSMQTAL